MSKKKPKNIIIDADVARAAGGKDAKHPTPKKCRDFLLAFLDTPHKMAMSPAIRGEWNKHQSKFAITWRKKIVASGKFVFVNPAPNIELEEEILSNLTVESNKTAIRKDFHLIEAALDCDKRVVSMDQTIRALFSSCAKQVPELTDIVWVNPTNEDETPIQWLKDGAPKESNRLLGS